jgi:hypothetical protein
MAIHRGASESEADVTKWMKWNFHLVAQPERSLSTYISLGVIQEGCSVF